MSPRAQTERQFQEALVQYARLAGWLVYHTHDSRRSEPGFPDLVVVRSGRLVFAELKSDGAQLSREQIRWVKALAETHDEVYVWRPADWPAIERILK